MNTPRYPQCPHCGKPMALGSEGSCPECLLKAGFQSEPGPSMSSGARPPLTPQELAPLFPQLEIVELIGRGGMGTVYKAKQRSLDRWVALKILSLDPGLSPNFHERFLREARTLAKVSHPHIVSIYDFGETASHYFLVMEFVEGPNLRQVLRQGKLTPAQALAIVPQICEALQFAHDKGVIHRDIKPENILLTAEGQVKIADFGLAKLLQPSGSPHLTQSREVMGTPHYMAPEQIEKPTTVDHRADLFSLGVVFYEMLTGELPLGRFQPPSKKVQMDVRLDEVVLRTLEKEPELRFQSAQDIRTEIRVMQEGPAPRTAPQPTPTSYDYEYFAGSKPLYEYIPAAWRGSTRVMSVASLAAGGFSLMLLWFFWIIWKGRPWRMDFWEIAFLGFLVAVWAGLTLSSAVLARGFLQSKSGSSGPIRGLRRASFFQTFWPLLSITGIISVAWPFLVFLATSRFPSGGVTLFGTALLLGLSVYLLFKYGNRIGVYHPGEKRTSIDLPQRWALGSALAIVFLFHLSSEPGRRYRHYVSDDAIPSQGNLNSIPFGTHSWQREDLSIIVMPDFFSDDSGAGHTLETYWKTGQSKATNGPASPGYTGFHELDKKSQLDMVKNGLRQAPVEIRKAVLKDIGNRYIWNSNPQDPDAIEIMFQALAQDGGTNDFLGIRHEAVYYGLSVVQPKTNPILLALSMIAMSSSDPAILERIAWGVADQKEQFSGYLNISNLDGSHQAKSDAIKAIVNGELNAYKWAEGVARSKALAKYEKHLDPFKKSLDEGDSSDRLQILTQIQQEKIYLIMDDSFLPAFQQSAHDSDEAVRNLTARLVSEKWVASAEEPAPEALSILTQLAEDDSEKVRFTAIYHGLSVVKKKNPSVLRLLILSAMKNPSPELFSRVQGSILKDRTNSVAILQEFAQGSDASLSASAVETARRLRVSLE